MRVLLTQLLIEIVVKTRFGPTTFFDIVSSTDLQGSVFDSRSISESYPWLSWLVESYDELPAFIAFMHPHADDWHRLPVAQVKAIVETHRPRCVAMLGKFALAPLTERCSATMDANAALKCYRGGYMVKVPRLTNAFLEYPWNCFLCHDGDDNDGGKRRMVTEEYAMTRRTTSGRPCRPCGSDVLELPGGEYAALRLAAAHLDLESNGWRDEAPLENWKRFIAGRTLGSEMLVSREAIRARPRKLYQGLIGLIRSHPDLAWGYAMERIWELLFTKSCPSTGTHHSF